MTRSMSWRLGKGATMTFALLASLVLTGGQTLAATRLDRSGTTGPYHFTDTTTAPGARCIYQGTAGAQDFDRVKVKAPTVKWIQTGAFHSGTVGWRIKLQHWNGHVWSTVRTTSEQRGFATQTHAAPLTARTVNWAPPHDRRYRVITKIRWMTPDAETIGSVIVRIDHYRRTFDGSVGSSCPAQIADF
jgi:hypothetical protein